MMTVLSWPKSGQLKVELRKSSGGVLGFLGNGDQLHILGVNLLADKYYKMWASLLRLETDLWASGEASWNSWAPRARLMISS